MTGHQTERSGFTLVELLVVIAIISVLAGILLPVLGKTLSSARSIQCQNQQKQIFLGLRMYADEYDGWMVDGYDKSLHDDSDIPRYWAARLAWTGHLGSSNYKQILKCPEPGAQNIVYQGHIFDGAGTRNYGLAYVEYDPGSHYAPGSCTYYNLNKTYRPSKLFILWDSRSSYWVSCNYYPGYPHAKGTNTTYADGHVEHFNYGKLIAHTWSIKLPYYNQKEYDPAAGFSTGFWAP